MQSYLTEPSSNGEIQELKGLDSRLRQCYDEWKENGTSNTVERGKENEKNICEEIDETKTCPGND